MKDDKLESAVKPAAAVYLDTPEINREVLALAANDDMQVSFETARMYTRRPPDLPVDRIFGVTSFELG